jgi:UDP-N-acetyl-D-glucosamine dehydrogenase
MLEEKGADVVYHDPYVAASARTDGSSREGVPFDDDEELEAADCILIATDHRDVDYRRLIGRDAPVVDARNAMRGLDSENIIGLSGQSRGGPLEAVVAAHASGAD